MVTLFPCLLVRASQRHFARKLYMLLRTTQSSWTVRQPGHAPHAAGHGFRQHPSLGLFLLPHTQSHDCEYCDNFNVSASLVMRPDPPFPLCFGTNAVIERMSWLQTIWVQIRPQNQTLY